jgi:hypothetical protein
MNHTQPYIDSITESRRSRDRRTFSDLFGEMPTVIVGQEIGPEHAVLLDALPARPRPGAVDPRHRRHRTHPDGHRSEPGNRLVERLAGRPGSSLMDTTHQWTCPLPSCEWTFEGDEEACRRALLASEIALLVYGRPGGEIREHIDSHPLLDWVDGARDLQRQVKALEALAPSTHLRIPAARWRIGS